ncbi:MAG: MFS transporter [Nocardioides sp.]|nr:MFS transporter [Nocardioides sp.]
MPSDTIAPGAESEDSSVRAHTSGGRATLELILVGLGALAVSLSQSVLIPVLGELQATYGANTNWLLTSTLLVAAVAVPIMGRLGDMFGKRLLLLIAIGTLVVGSLIDALSDSLGWLIVGRAIQGVSAAAIPLGISLLATLLPREKVGNAVAIISAMLGVGGALGLPFAGFIAENSDWHTLFWVNGAVGLVAFVGILLIVPESKQRTGGRVDVVGAVLLSAALAALVLPLEQGQDWGWSSGRTLGLFAAAAVLLVVFAVAELRIGNPLVDLSALRRKPIVLTNLASILFAFALFASFIGTATFVEAGKWTHYGFGSSLMVGGLTLLPSGIAMLIFSPIAARLIAKIGAPRTLALGAFIVAIGWTCRYFFSDSLVEVIIGTTISGAGTGIGYAAMPTLINTNTPPNEIAAANGLNSLFRSLGSTLASAIGTSILASSYVVYMVNSKPVMHAGKPVAAPSIDAYNWLFITCAVVSVLSAVIALLIPRGEQQAG